MTSAPPTPALFSFQAGDSGPWAIDSVTAICGENLPAASHLHVAELPLATHSPPGGIWTLLGTTSNLRYTTQSEAAALRAVQPPLLRPEATCAALIPIRKAAAWWALAQDQRRALLEEQSRHIAIGLEYLPPIARRLHHSRELAQPFDFLTWFEFAPEHTPTFNQLLARLRSTPEWTYVDREVDIRLSRRLPALPISD